MNSILYQRGIYPPELFTRESKYGLSMMITNDIGLKAYIKKILAQLDSWLMDSSVRKLVLVVKGVETGATLERWMFNCVTPSDENSSSAGNEGATELSTAAMGKKSIKEVQQEIQAIMRQITASVTFLPLLNEPCSFDLLVYADPTASVPAKWEDSDPCIIMKSEEVRLRSFTTQIHSVDAMVHYRVDDDI